MNSKAREELRQCIIVNAFNKRYPTDAPSTNTLEHHIKIYELIDEYNSLMEDMMNASSSTVKLISPRLKEIERELTHFWIIKDDELIMTKKED